MNLTCQFEPDQQASKIIILLSIYSALSQIVLGTLPTPPTLPTPLHHTQLHVHVTYTTERAIDSFPGYQREVWE